MQIKELGVFNTKILAGLDDDFKLHLLDLNGPMSLTNALTRRYCKEIIKQLDDYTPIDFCTIICYHTDGVISSFDINTGNFKFLAPDHEWVNNKFKEEMYYLYMA